MRQPVDSGGGQRVVDVERLAAIPRFAIRGCVHKYTGGQTVENAGESTSGTSMPPIGAVIYISRSER
jgi:hypothetical protein